MQFKPLTRHVEVQPIKEEIFGDAQEALYEERGTVVSIADGVTTVKVGDIVFFESWLCKKSLTGEKLESGEEKVRYLVQEDNLLGVAYE